MDIRTEKTKRGIQNAFLELRARKPIEKITVKELSERAQINKSTFYTYYTDIYDLSEQMEEDVVRLVMANISDPGGLIRNPSSFTRELFLAYLSQDQLIRILFSGSRGGLLIAKIRKGLEDKIFGYYAQYREDPRIRFILAYAIYGGYYAFQEFRGREDGSLLAMEEEVAERLIGLIEPLMKQGGTEE